MEPKRDEKVVPVIAEELHADAVPVKTGGVRVIKRVDGHDEILEQELRKGHVQVKRVKTDRVVEGPQPVQHAGNTIIIPVVSERLRIEKEWVVTEEIHITQTEEREKVEQKVRLNEERAEVQRIDEHGNAIAHIESPAEQNVMPACGGESIVPRRGDTASTSVSGQKYTPLSKRTSILKDKGRNPKVDR